MKLTSMIPPQVNLADGCFTAPDVQRKSTTLGSLSGIFADAVAWQSLPAALAVYQVEMLPSVQQEGELFVGTTHLQPGRVGDEFFMTRGHFHQRPEQAEFYLAYGAKVCCCCNTRTALVRWNRFPPVAFIISPPLLPTV